MKSIEKKFYKIGDVAELLEIPPSTLRFWEKQFTILKPKRYSNNFRYYTLDDIEKIKMIYYLVKEKGLKLSAAENQVMHNRKNVSRRKEVIDRLKDTRDELQKLLDSIDNMIEINR